MAIIEGRLDGEITTEEYGSNGFGYDSIFAVNGKTYAEMNALEKNCLSHRAIAIKAIIPVLQKIINT